MFIVYRGSGQRQGQSHFSLYVTVCLHNGQLKGDQYMKTASNCYKELFCAANSCPLICVKQSP